MSNNYLKYKRLKKNLFTLLVFQIISVCLYGACPCNSIGCTFTSTAGTDATAYTIGAGQKLCIPAGSIVTGNITLTGGGTISNQGTFSSANFTYGSGTFDNCGIITTNITIPAGSVFTNCSSGTVTNTNFTIGNTGTFTNYGTITVSGMPGTFSIGNTSTFNNYSIICVSKDFTCGNGSTQNNYGVINTYNFINGNASTFYNECTIDISNDFTLANASIISGPTSGAIYGRFNVNGASNIYAGTIFGSGTEQLDMCDAGNPPGGFDIKLGSVGASVTYCTKSGCTVTGSCCSPPTPAITGTNTICNGNSTTLTANGGGTYSWSTGATAAAITVSPIITTTYTVTVNNGGCVSSATKVVTINPKPTSSITSQNNVNCTGNASGTATVTGVGGTPGYTYSWASGQTTAVVTGLTAGNYNVTISDSKGCTSSQTVTITQPASALGSTLISQGNVSCTGSAAGSATVTGTGGTPSYTYSWNNGQTAAAITGLTAGIYSVTITDNNNCTKFETVVITQPASAVTATASSTDAACGGSNGNATVSASGGTGSLTYQWSAGGQTSTTAINLSAGSYNVTVTDANGCTVNASVSVNNASGPTVGIASQANVLCNGLTTGSATVTATGGTGTLVYNWNNGVTSTTGSASGLSAGTYIVTVTDGNGCAQGQTINITQPTNGLGASISSQNNVGCTGGTTGNATVTGTGGTPLYTYSWSPGGQTTAAVTGLTSGSYNITITDANNCTAIQTVAITQPASALGSTILSQDNVGCTGSPTGSATVTGSGGTPVYLYNWNNGETTAAVAGLTAGNYNVTITDANGCSATKSVAITQPASALGLTISSQGNVNCTDSASGSATVTGTGGAPNYTYNWSNGKTTATVTGLIAGAYNVTITDNNGCSATQTVAITQPASSLSSIVSSQTNVGCTGGATGSAAVTGTGGTPVYTYSWSSGQTTSAVNGLISGAYNVTITDANGCTATQTVAITQPASGVNAVTNSTNATCGNANGTVSVTASGGTPGYTYNWTPTGGTNSIANNLSAAPYTVTITDANGCQKTAAVTISNLGAPTVSIVSQSDANCNGSATGSATVSTSGSGPGYTYNWSPAGGTDTTAIGLTAGTYIFTVTDTNGCKQSQSITINEPNILSSFIASQVNVKCYGDGIGSATVSVTGGTPTYLYSWSNNNNTNSTASGLTAGTYSVTVTDKKGCTQIQNVTITQPLTGITLTPNTTNAACGSSNGTASLIASGGTGTLTYNWKTPNNDITPTVTGLLAGSYTVIVTDSNSCTQSALAKVNETPGPVATATSNNITCNGMKNGSATVNVNSGTAPFSYTWNPNVTTNNATNGLSANTYTVTVSDSASCTSTTQITITEPLPITFSISPLPSSICAGETIVLTTSTPTGGTPPFIFTWLPNGPAVSPTVPTTYTVTVKDSSGCISLGDTVLVTPLPAPIAGFDTLSSGMFHQQYNFNDLSIGASKWNWNFGDGATSTLQNPFHTFSAGTYSVTLIVTNASGCKDTITKTVVIRSDFFIPNVFTPNNDGINDEFWIPNSGFESFELAIYNRWGIKLFVTDAGEIRWDGRTSAGQEVTDGTYFYILNAKLKTENTNEPPIEKKGFINLVRGGQ